MTFHFDNSLLGDSTLCEAKSVVKHALGRQAKRQDLAKERLYGPMGNVGHATFETHFGGGSREQVGQTIDLEYDKIVPVGQVPDEPMMAKENLKTIFDVYCEKRPVEKFPWVVVEQEKMIGIEMGDDLKMWFKRDMLVQDKKTGLHYPVDHKTRWGQINEWWTKKFRKCSQFTGYIWATREQTGEPVDKIYVNALSCGKLPDSTRKCKVHKVPFLECRRQHVQMELLTYSRLEEQIQKWRMDVVHWAKQVQGYFKVFNSVEMLPMALRRGEFNEGCTFCEFADWCRQGFDPDLMDEYTVYEPWRPWEEKKEAVPVPGAGDVEWYYRIANDMICAVPKGTVVGENWGVLPERMALKKLWDKGREHWMRVWGECKQAQRVMAQFAREREVE